MSSEGLPAERTGLLHPCPELFQWASGKQQGLPVSRGLALTLAPPHSPEWLRSRLRCIDSEHWTLSLLLC